MRREEGGGGATNHLVTGGYKAPICIILGLQGQSVLPAKCQMFLTT